jgi:hypothetical protein
VVKEVNTKDDIFGFEDGHPARFVKSPRVKCIVGPLTCKNVSSRSINSEIASLGPSTC